MSVRGRIGIIWSSQLQGNTRLTLVDVGLCGAESAGAVFDNREGERIAGIMGKKGKVGILQNHGIVSLGRLSIDEAAWWYVDLSFLPCSNPVT